MLKQKNQMLLSSDICQYTYMYCIVYTSRGLFYFFFATKKIIVQVQVLNWFFFFFLQLPGPTTHKVSQTFN